jgi:hypothetical protein
MSPATPLSCIFARFRRPRANRQIGQETLRAAQREDSVPDDTPPPEYAEQETKKRLGTRAHTQALTLCLPHLRNKMVAVVMLLHLTALFSVPS